MAFHWNAQTGRMEDEQGNPAPAEGVPMDQLAGAPKPVVLDPTQGTPISDLAGAPPVAEPIIKRPSGTVTGKTPVAAPSATGPTLTSHVGGTSITQPIGADGVVQKTSGGTTVSGVRVSPEERAAEKERERLAKEEQAAAEEAGKAARQRAIEESAAADERAQVQREAAVTKQMKLEQNEKDVQVAAGQAQEAENAWKKSALESTESRNTFWARQDTGMKVRSGISLLLGIVGGLTDGSNVGAERINHAIDQDAERFKQKMLVREQILERSKGNVAEARQRIKDQLGMIDIRTAAALESVAAEAEARGKRLGIDDAQLKSNAGIVALRQRANDERMKWLETTRQHITTESGRTISTGGGAGTGGDKMLHASSDDTNALANAANALKSMDAAVSAIGTTNGKAWGEFSKAYGSQRKMDALTDAGGNVGSAMKVARGLGVADLSIQDRLKGASPEAKQLGATITQLREAIAKAAGGVITETDRQSADQQLAIAAVSSPAEAAKIINREKSKMETKVKLALANKRYNLPEGVLPEGFGGGGQAAPAVPADNSIQTRMLKDGTRVKVRRNAAGQWEEVQ